MKRIARVRTLAVLVALTLLAVVASQAFCVGVALATGESAATGTTASTVAATSGAATAGTAATTAIAATTGATPTASATEAATTAATAATTPTGTTATVQGTTVSPYGVYIGGIPVTEANKGDVLGDGTVSFDYYGGSPVVQSAQGLQPSVLKALGTIHLSGSSISGAANEHGGAAIYAEGPIIVDLTGDNIAMGASTTSGDATAIYALGHIGFSGSGALYALGGAAGAGNSIGIRSAELAGVAAGDISTQDSVVIEAGGSEAGTSSTNAPSDYSVIGIFATGRISTSDTSKLAGVALYDESTVLPLSSVGIACNSLSTWESSLVYAAATGGATSAGLSAQAGVFVSDSSDLTTTGTDGTTASYGIYTMTGDIEFSGSYLLASASSVKSGALSRAFAVAPSVTSPSYHWRTSDADTFTTSSTKPYAHSSTQDYVELATSYDLRVGGVDVTDANRENILAGTANDGKVSYQPGGVDGAAGTLKLSGASITGVAGQGYGAGIAVGVRGPLELAIELTGKNTVTGAEGSSTDKMAAGITAGHVILTGTGSLDVTSADIAGTKGNRSYALDAPLTTKDSVTVTLKSGTGYETAGMRGYLVMSGTSSLKTTGGNATSVSYGAKLTGGGRISGSAVLDSIGGTADKSYGAKVIWNKFSATDDSSVTFYSHAATTEGIALLNSTDVDAPVFSGNAQVYLESDDAPTSQVSNTDFDLSAHNAYRWIADDSLGTGATTEWVSSSTTPYVYSSTYNFMQVDRDDTYPIWLGTVQVTVANRDDILAGTQNAGKARFVPAHDGEPNTLYLDGVNLTAGSYNHEGAAIRNELPLVLVLTGENTAAGGEGVRSISYGLASYSALTITGTGSLELSALPMSYESYALNQFKNLTLSGDVHVSATSGSSEYSIGAIVFGNLYTKDNAQLKGTTTASTGETAGVGAYGIRAEGSSLIEGIAGSSETEDSSGVHVYSDTVGKDPLGGHIEVSGNATVRGTGSTAQAAKKISSGVRAPYASIDGGMLWGMGGDAPYSYGIFSGTTTSSPLVATGGTVIAQATAQGSGEASALAYAPDLTGYESYLWRTSPAAGYTHNGFVYLASDTYTEIVPGAKPAVEPENGTTEGGTVEGGTLPDTGDPLTAPATGLGIAALLGCVGILAARRMRGSQA